MIKRSILGIITCMVLVLGTSTTAFADTTKSVEIEYMDDGSYFETVIEEATPGITLFAAATTKTGSKTTQCKNGAGTVLWSVKVTGTFSYNGSSSSCKSSTVSTTAPASAWSIKGSSASKSGNMAKATATAVKKQNGAVIQTETRNVSLTCSKNGSLS